MFEVKESGIHGLGLFSVDTIKKGTILGTCKTRKTEVPNDYTLWVEDQPYDVVCNLKYINHSDNPNVVYFDDLTVVALKNIQSGEELTHNYEQ